MCEMDKMNTPINVYLNLAKVVYTLDSDILQDKLPYCGINEVVKANSAVNAMMSY